MKLLICEMCGSTDLIKQDGIFVCQFCGCKYSVDEAKKMMFDGAVKIDNSGELANLYQLARRAKDDANREDAAKYYDMILLKDPMSWEAAFYAVYFKAMECKIAQIRSAAISVTKSIDNVLELVRDNVADTDERKKAYTEVADRVIEIARMLFSAAKNHYNNIDPQIRYKYKQEWLNNAFAAMECVYTLGNNLDSLFGSDSEANGLSSSAWIQGVTWHQSLMYHLADKEGNRKAVNDYNEKIKKYDSSFALPEESSGSCYVATAVYGSYDCPQVCTLRRYRDYVLSKTWYGRAFIRIYYAVSPTLVKWFGQTDWFKKLWRGKLDRMVTKLQSKGIESTPYEDNIR